MSSTRTLSRPRSAASRMAARPSARRVATFLRSRNPEPWSGISTAPGTPGMPVTQVESGSDDVLTLSAYANLRSAQICAVRILAVFRRPADAGDPEGDVRRLDRLGHRRQQVGPHGFWIDRVPKRVRECGYRLVGVVADP